MLFSHRDVVRLLGSAFECSWESVRPVPTVEIDFGNGHRLSRTLAGNIAFYYATPDGLVFDLLPGLVGPEEFLRKTTSALAAFRQHGGQRDAEQWFRLQHLISAETGEPAVARAPAPVDVSKAAVEQPLKHAMGTLEEDTEFNRRERYPRAHRLLARTGLVRPAELTKVVYREILEVDLDDPYLGLAPYLLGGEGGRHG